MDNNYTSPDVYRCIKYVQLERCVFAAEGGLPFRYVKVNPAEIGLPVSCAARHRHFKSTLSTWQHP